MRIIATLKGLIEFEGWTDLGGAAARWGGEANEFTCLAHNSNTPTRRDYMLANQDALRLVRGFRVLHAEPFPVHSVLQVRITAGEPDHAPFGKKDSQSLYDALRAHCAEECAYEKATKQDKEQQRGNKEAAGQRQGSAVHTTDEAGQDETHPGPRDGDDEDMGTVGRHDEEGGDTAMDDDNKENLISTTAWNAYLTRLYDNMDKKLESSEAHLKDL